MLDQERQNEVTWISELIRTDRAFAADVLKVDTGGCEYSDVTTGRRWRVTVAPVVPHEVAETHPGWTGTCRVTRADVVAAGGVPTEKIEEAAKAAMQAWADDPQCRWWLPGDNVDVVIADDPDIDGQGATLRVRVPARFFRWLAPAGETP